MDNKFAEKGLWHLRKDIARTYPESIKLEIYRSSSPTELIDGEWSDDTQLWENDKYVWIRNVMIFGGNVVEVTPPLCISGPADGAEISDDWINEFLR